jgi:hypothetical protein
VLSGIKIGGTDSLDAGGLEKVLTGGLNGHGDLLEGSQFYLKSLVDSGPRIFSGNE